MVGGAKRRARGEWRRREGRRGREGRGGREGGGGRGEGNRGWVQGGEKEGGRRVKAVMGRGLEAGVQRRV